MRLFSGGLMFVRMKNTTTTITALLFSVALAACVGDEPMYPTETYRTVDHTGATVTTYGAQAYDVCETIGALACDDDRCEQTFMAYCMSNVNAGLILHTASVPAWDALWSDCLHGISKTTCSTYQGNVQIEGCEKLTPYWAAP